MRALTCLMFVLTVIASWLSYGHEGAVAEVVKLAYAYLALISIVCTMIMLTMKRREPQTVAQLSLSSPVAAK